MRTAITALVLLLTATGCATSAARLDAAWETFESEHAAVLAHAERAVPVIAERARASGDDALLERVTSPPGSPVAVLCYATAVAGTAYMTGDVEGIQTAIDAVRTSERELCDLERASAANAH